MDITLKERDETTKLLTYPLVQHTIVGISLIIRYNGLWFEHRGEGGQGQK